MRSGPKSHREGSETHHKPLVLHAKANVNPGSFRSHVHGHEVVPGPKVLVGYGEHHAFEGRLRERRGDFDRRDAGDDEEVEAGEFGEGEESGKEGCVRLDGDGEGFEVDHGAEELEYTCVAGWDRGGAERVGILVDGLDRQMDEVKGDRGEAGDGGEESGETAVEGKGKGVNGRRGVAQRVEHLDVAFRHGDVEVQMEMAKTREDVQWEGESDFIFVYGKAPGEVEYL